LAARCAGALLDLQSCITPDEIDRLYLSIYP
jgi:hypothetical protein